MQLPQPRVLLISEAADHVVAACGVTKEQAIAALERAFREFLIPVFGKNRQSAFDDWEPAEINWTENRIERHGGHVFYTVESARVYRQHIDEWLEQANPQPKKSNTARDQCSEPAAAPADIREEGSGIEIAPISTVGRPEGISDHVWETYVTVQKSVPDFDKKRGGISKAARAVSKQTGRTFATVRRDIHRAKEALRQQK